MTLVVNAFTLGAGAGNLTVAGLPFTSENNGNGGIWAAFFSGIDLSAGTVNIVSQVSTNGTTVAFLETKDNAEATVVPLSALAAGDTIRFSGTYKV